MSAGDPVVYLDGAYVPASEALISVTDHGFLYGDGVFESIVAIGGRVFALAEHVQRLFDSARGLRLEIPVRADELQEGILETLRRNGERDAYCRVVVSRGSGYLSLDPRVASRPTVAVITYPMGEPSQISGLFRPDGVKLQIVSVRKTPSISLESRIKSLNYLNSICARIEAVEAGADEALLLDVDGFVAEAAAANVFAVRGTELVTPPVEHILDGITRRAVLRLAADAGVTPVERRMTAYDLFTADEIFLSSTAGGVIAVMSVNGARIGGGSPGPHTCALHAAYQELVRTTGTRIPPASPVSGSGRR